MRNTDLAGKNVVVVGLGMSGLASAEFLLDKGARVTATDILPLEKHDRRIRNLADRGAILELGSHKTDTFLSADLIVISPGVPSDLEPLRQARTRGVAVAGEVELASWFVTAPIIAVTGTNGKSTVTALIGEILEGAGFKAFVGGNIGNPLINLVRSGQEVGAAVVEVSSFQLETADSFHPRAALLLNLSPDHLDRHRTFEVYVEAKRRIFARQQSRDTAILNADDELCAGSETKARVLMFSRKKKIQNGACLENGRIRVSLAGRVEGLLPIQDLTLKGGHNQENVMAALLAAAVLGVEMGNALNTVKEFRGLPHRVQLVAEIDGVEYYDDSKGTNVGAVLRSLEGFSRPVILIAGGRDKDGDFNLLKPAVETRVRLLILLGEAAEKIASALSGSVETILVADMAEAVALARQRAGRGEVVLLSPACASFDMFRDYKHRGQVFSELVLKEKAA